jgi:hypothetical protein
VEHAILIDAVSESGQRRRWRRRSDRDGEPATSQVSWILVDDVFTCWPPGPPDLVAWSRISARGMEKRRLIGMDAGSLVIFLHPVGYCPTMAISTDALQTRAGM